MEAVENERYFWPHAKENDLKALLDGCYVGTYLMIHAENSDNYILAILGAQNEIHKHSLAFCQISDIWSIDGQRTELTTLKKLLKNAPNFAVKPKYPLYTLSDKYENQNTFHEGKRKIGCALIVNISTFTDGSDPRPGSERDVSSLRLTLEARGYEVTTKSDLTWNGLFNAIQSFAEDPRHDGSASLVISLMSHGSNGVIFTKEGSPFYISRIQEILSNRNSPRLAGMLKIIIVNSCRGRLRQIRTTSNLQQDAQSFSHHGTMEPLTELDHCNTIIWCSTINEYVSNRDTERGSWFIQSICKVLNDKRHSRLELSTLFQEVQKELKTFGLDLGEGQTSSYYAIGVEKKFYFGQAKNSNVTEIDAPSPNLPVVETETTVTSSRSWRLVKRLFSRRGRSSYNLAPASNTENAKEAYTPLLESVESEKRTSMKRNSVLRGSSFGRFGQSFRKLKKQSKKSSDTEE